MALSSNPSAAKKGNILVGCFWDTPCTPRLEKSARGANSGGSDTRLGEVGDDEALGHMRQLIPRSIDCQGDLKKP
jgi:hypothetical protein